MKQLPDGSLDGLQPEDLAGSADKLLVTPAEAAHRLSISRSKVYELLYEGVLPSVKLGTCRRIPADALRRLVENLAT